MNMIDKDSLVKAGFCGNRNIGMNDTTGDMEATYEMRKQVDEKSEVETYEESAGENRDEDIDGTTEDKDDEIQEKDM